MLVSKLHQPTLRAIAYAQATRPDTLTAVTVNVDEKDTRELQAEWERREHAGAADRRRLAVPGDHPADHRLRRSRIRRESPRDVVTVFIPEYVVGRWWENLLHNQSALRLKGRLLFEPGVMVTSVPWQLASTASKDLDRLDATLSRGPARGPRVAPRSTLPPSRAAGGRRTAGETGPAGERPVTAGEPVVDRRGLEEAERVELTVGAVAHGGHCVARLDGQVVFVRHALPGERVRRRGHRAAPGLPARRRGRDPRRRRRTGSSRPARTPGRAAAAAATCSTSAPGRPAATGRPRWCASS